MGTPPPIYHSPNAARPRNKRPVNLASSHQMQHQCGIHNQLWYPCNQQFRTFLCIQLISHPTTHPSHIPNPSLPTPFTPTSTTHPLPLCVVHQISKLKRQLYDLAKDNFRSHYNIYGERYVFFRFFSPFFSCVNSSIFPTT